MEKQQERKRERNQTRNTGQGEGGEREDEKLSRARGRGCALRDLHMRILYLIYCVDHPPLYLLACGSYQQPRPDTEGRKERNKGEGRDGFPRLLALELGSATGTVNIARRQITLTS